MKNSKLGDASTARNLYDFSAYDFEGNLVSLAEYAGKVVVIVNVATKCLHAEKHFREFAYLAKKYRDKEGLRIIAFPCDQFVSEHRDANDDFECLMDMAEPPCDFFAKVDVNGSNMHPLWQWLKKKTHSVGVNFIMWNFTKFIVDRNGYPVERFSPNTSPMEMENLLLRLF
ncbi:glutathione peroxidase-like [Lutzomyia longipalpis]|uniref:glutathione peroxidase-like n=1 Tax=Lutzomyia longipalpis TaxID=7200 RepID=UPI0024845546|nr:glutathione peroxidase-like [Lutzomyia longipalpis]